MDAKKVTQHCDMLRALIGVGPGDNPDILRKALGIVRSLYAAANWDYPQQILKTSRSGSWLGLVIANGGEMRRSCVALFCGISTSCRRPGRNRSATRPHSLSPLTASPGRAVCRESAPRLGSSTYY